MSVDIVGAWIATGCCCGVSTLPTSSGRPPCSRASSATGRPSESGSSSGSSSRRGPTTRPASLDGLLASGGRVYVAEVDGEPVGVGGLKLLGEKVGEIKRMFVRPEARGLGVGREIVVQLIEDARTLGCETLVLESATFMHSAHALYRSVGFVPTW